MASTSKEYQDLAWVDSFDPKKEKQSGNRKFPPNV